MARIRSVHPGLFTDEAFVQVSPEAQIFFVGLLTESDDAGAFEWKPITLKMRLRPASNSSADPLLAELAAVGMIQEYRHAGRKYGAVRNFNRFQRPRKPNPIHFMPPEIRIFVALYGPYSELSGDEDGQVPKKSELGDVNEQGVRTNSEITPQMEDGIGGGKGRREDGRNPSKPPKRGSSESDTDFDAFWKCYPRKTAKDEAFKAWIKVLKSGVTAAEIMLGLARHVFHDEPKFIKYPASWLNAGCWKDEPMLRVNGKVGDKYAFLLPDGGLFGNEDDEPEFTGTTIEP